MERVNTLVGRLRIRHFDFLGRLGRNPNLARVAAEMNMAYSTATKMLQDIEDILGVALFPPQPATDLDHCCGGYDGQTGGPDPVGSTRRS
ncbi:helix-turn-helix domain-containing protein [Sulfitobacter sp.]|uniref:helix-turn-helix domain-containing protein n=1 Tax=Sulfitobacter sp. TaxID=1903071 RepID=UPI0030017CAB